MELFTQRVLFGIASHAAVREHQISAQRRNPHLSILRIFRSLFDCLFPIFSPCTDPALSWTPETGAPQLQHAASLHIQPEEVEAAGLAFPSPQRSAEFPNVFHRSVVKEGKSWNCNLHNTHGVCKQLNCRAELQTLPALWQVPTPEEMGEYHYWCMCLGGARMGRL